MYSEDGLEDNLAVQNSSVTRAVGSWRSFTPGALLRLGPEPLSVAWLSPSEQQWAVGLGVASERFGDVGWVGEAPPVAPPGPWFGGWVFDPQRNWDGFDKERWVLPEVLAWWDGTAARVAAFGSPGTTKEALDARLDRLEEQAPITTPNPATRQPGDRSAWAKVVEQALSNLRQGRFQKLVAARVIEVEAEQPFVERSVLKALEARHPTCRTFLVRGRTGAAFVGASPELLCRAHDGVFETEALAGTAAPGEEAALLASEKDRREHDSVVQRIVQTLQRFAVQLERPPEPGTRRLANVVHLHTPIRATLRPGVDPLEVAKALHPTPAVSGWPKVESMTWLRRHEGFSRGWYAGVVGARGPGGVTLAVALRSALLEGRHAKVFVGCGLVTGSRVDPEWEETERKALAVLPALGVES
jgi:salicylate biosynthesis isochorismate synthase/menaquinone-specific isochorismate synthase